MRGLLTVITILCALTTESRGASRLEPIDERGRNPAFLAFRAELQRTIAVHDVPGLLRVVDPHIKNSFGGDDRVEAFARRWRLKEGDSEVWRALGSLLALGGTFDGPDTFVAPYVFSRWPAEIDAFEYTALVGSNVRVRSAPTRRSRILDTLSFALLRRGGDPTASPRSWIPVVLADGRRGFVASHLARSSIDYRAYFTREAGRWRMTALVSGD